MRARRFILGLVALTLGACSAEDDAATTAPDVATSAADVATTVPGTDAPVPASTLPPATTAAVATTAEASTTTTSTTTTTLPETTTSTVAATTTTTTPLATSEGVPVVEAAAYAVFDMRSGQLLASSEADARRPVGSLMKLLAAHVGYSAGQPTRIVTAPEGLVLFPGDESIVGISPGQQYSRDTLIRAMLKVSANDAARMLAIDIAGSEAAYAGLMNANAAALGLANTNAVNVTGLDAEGQYSSANDLVRLGVTLMGGITFQQTVKEDSATLGGQAFPNTNDLLGVYPGADGIKTGRTSGAGWCILASATRDGRRVVAAVLGAPTEAARDQAATALLDFGFAQP